MKDLTAEEEKELDALRLKKYGRAMTGVGLRELQTKEAKDANGGEDQDESGESEGEDESGGSTPAPSAVAASDSDSDGEDE